MLPTNERASDRQLELVAQLAGPIGESFRRNALRRVNGSSTAAGPGVLLFDRDGRLISLDEQAAAWLTELGAPPDETLSDLRLPTEVLAILSYARAVAVERERGRPSARLQTKQGRWLAAHATQLRGTEPDHAQIVLVLEPIRSDDLAPLIADAYGLTSREQEVTRLLAQGLGTEEIASTLFLSAHTVRGYLKAIFEKVGVGSRGELVARIFTEHYADRLLDGIQQESFGPTVA